jgi:hypothetical protein
MGRHVGDNIHCFRYARYCGMKMRYSNFIRDHHAVNGAAQHAVGQALERNDALGEQINQRPVEVGLNKRVDQGNLLEGETQALLLVPQQGLHLARPHQVVEAQSSAHFRRARRPPTLSGPGQWCRQT